jgi:Kef-type K+ transport system membrane component KefB
MSIIITLCCLLLLAYLFDLTSSKTKIPSVILLLLLGWAVKQIAVFFGINVPELSGLLPTLGTIGLILIVLEGSLELEFNKSKTVLVRKSFVVAFIPILLLGFLFAFLFYCFGDFSFKDSLANAIPLCVISSAIAIPSAKYLAKSDKEFVVYESSLSDILGVLFFNFIVLNEIIDVQSFGHFALQLVIIAVISFGASIGLSYLLSKIDHPIKFAPIIILIILIYEISKIYHLPALVFILLFGLFLGNLDELNFKWTRFFQPQKLNQEVKKFKELTTEATFIVRSVFFILFGYLIETAEVLNIETLPWAVSIVAAIFSIRVVMLLLYKFPLMPLLFIAPRGLITILLFLSIPVSQVISLVNKSLIIQVIILTALIMMTGLMLTKTTSEKSNI